MPEQALPTGTRCPVCGQGQLDVLTRTEEFDFDLGGETIKVRAENVPIKKCDHCGEEMKGTPKIRVIRIGAPTPKSTWWP